MQATTSHEFLAHLSEGATLFAFVVIIQWQQIAHGSERCYRRLPFRIQMSEKTASCIFGQCELILDTRRGDNEPILAFKHHQ